MTAALVAAGAAVTALEYDRDLIAPLRARADLQTATIVEADAMEFDFDAYAEDASWHVAGNLPYNIGTPLLLRLAQSERGPQRIVAMIQRDVAARLTARPSTPAYGSLTLAVEYTMSVQRAFVLGPQHFYPRPKVDSAVVVLRRRERPAVETRDPQLLLKVVRAAFAYRRKTLANSLTLAMQIDRERTQSALRALALSPEIRGEQLDLAAFAAITDALAG